MKSAYLLAGIQLRIFLHLIRKNKISLWPKYVFRLLFVFQNAVLTNVAGPYGASNSDCSGCIAKYVTTYSNGQLTINPNGPCGKFKGIIPAATNISLHDQDGNLLKFILLIPEKGVTATWINYGDNYKLHTDDYGAYVYQMGSEFDSIILTCEPPAPVFY